ncbi:MAG: hypothetical protein NTZ05_12255 [Chloroflexi bacterium]|nr:hypothetical protein [Chloroflexota bacterium]
MQSSQGATKPHAEGSRRTAARARIADYHAKQQEELLRPVVELIDRKRNGEADVWEVDTAIRAYEKATRELHARMSPFYKSSIPLPLLLEFLEKDAAGEDAWAFLMNGP